MSSLSVLLSSIESLQYYSLVHLDFNLITAVEISFFTGWWFVLSFKIFGKIIRDKLFRLFAKMPFYQFFAVISFDQFATKMIFDQFLSIQSPEASSKWSGCVKAVDLVVQMWQVISTGWTPIMKT